LDAAATAIQKKIRIVASKCKSMNTSSEVMEIFQHIRELGKAVETGKSRQNSENP
jgi:hypothetical protein